MACCLPDAPGRCPGPANCPLMQPDPPEPREPAPNAVIKITCAEFTRKGELTYVEWEEDSSNKTFWGGTYFAPEHPIPRAVREALAKVILEEK